jgi:hypothetical protein
MVNDLPSQGEVPNDLTKIHGSKGTALRKARLADTRTKDMLRSVRSRPRQSESSALPWRSGTDQCAEVRRRVAALLLALLLHGLSALLAERPQVQGLAVPHE